MINILLFFILFVPTQYQYVKLVILLLIAIDVHRKKVYINNRIFFWVIFFMGSNAFFLFKGCLINELIFYQNYKIYLVWPVLYLFCVIAPVSVFHKINFHSVFIVSFYFIFFSIVMIFLSFLGILPDRVSHIFFIKSNVETTLGFLNFFIPSITSLLFLIPYLITWLIISNEKFSKKIIPYILIFFALVISVFIGRRALLLVIVMAPMILFLLHRFIIKQVQINSNYYKICTIIIIAALFFYYNPYKAQSRITYYQQNETSLLGQVRSQQLKALIHGWQEKPVLGAGIGVNASYIASHHFLGAYELSYVARLFQTGIVGFFIFIYMLYWILEKLVLIAKKTTKKKSVFIVCYIVGYISILIANATNPYLMSFDGLWVIFLGLAIVNWHMVRGIV